MLVMKSLVTMKLPSYRRRRMQRVKKRTFGFSELMLDKFEQKQPRRLAETAQGLAEENPEGHSEY
jgi:hypothetical protein